MRLTIALVVCLTCSQAAAAQTTRFTSAVKVRFDEATGPQRITPPTGQRRVPLIAGAVVPAGDAIDCKMVKRPPPGVDAKIRTVQPAPDIDHRLRTIAPPPCAK